jgi:hypothetical protein
MNALGLTGTQWFIVILVGMLVLGSMGHAFCRCLGTTIKKYYYVSWVNKDGELQNHRTSEVDFQKAMDHTKPSPGSLFRK